MNTINTIKKIVDDLLLTIRNSNIAESEHISRLQVEQWIHTYRALLIKREIDKRDEVNPMYIQEMNNVHLTPIDGGSTEYGNVGYRRMKADVELPKLVALRDFTGSGLLSVTDLKGNPIQIGSKAKAKFQMYRKYACNDYIAVLTGQTLEVYGPGILQYVNLEVIAEDPTDIDDCDMGDDKPYPMPADMIPLMKELIFKHEFGIMLERPSDNTNNTENELANGIVK